jgi:hypothetical protein
MSAGGLDDLDDWVLTDPVPDVVMRMTAMRRGDPALALKPRPAAALRILHKFARRREVADLLESTGHFEHLDAMSILATAALSRRVEEAAELAIGQWERESREDSGQTRLSYGIVYDVASQRTAPEVARFIKACRRKPEAKLADQTLRVFGGSGSTRTNLDKARLYIMLRDDDCESEAAELLRLTLREAGKRAQAPETNGPDELHDLVGALHHLSPSQRILEDWIKEAMSDPLDLTSTVSLVANLLAAAPRGAESLAEYVGATWDHHDLVQVCGLLHEGAPEAGDAVRGHLAARRDFRFLAEIIITWHKSASLTKGTKDLIAAIVAQGESSDAVPRPKAEIDRILANLEAYGAPAQCLRMLRTEAAAHIEGRTGDEVAELLHCIDNRRERQLAARIIGERLAEKVLRERTEADEELFVDYLKALRSREDADSTYWALRELPDPVEADQAGEGAAAVIGAIAKRLYAEGLDEAGFNLLERCLENEQWVTPSDVGEVVASLRDSRMPAEGRLDLLSATVGRWSELRRRGQAVIELHERGFDDEAEAVIQSLR